MEFKSEDMPDRNEIEKLLREDLKNQGINPDEVQINFGMPEDVVVLSIAGGFLHNLEFVDDPIFFHAVNATLGVKGENGEDLPVEKWVHKKIPLTISGYGLLDKTGQLVGFACFQSQIQEG